MTTSDGGKAAGSEGSVPGHPVIVVTSAWQGTHWDVEVTIDGANVGGGTTPDYPLVVADDILYGTKNDWLNDDNGALSRVPLTHSFIAHSSDV